MACLPLYPAHGWAAEWTLNNSFQTRLEANDNTQLGAQATAVVYTQSVSGSVSTARKTESTATRLDLGATAYLPNGSGDVNHANANLALNQSLADLLNQWEGGLSFQQDNTYNTRSTVADVSLGRGTRRGLSLNLGWSRLIDERWSGGLRLGGQRTTYGSELNSATPFTNVTAGANLSYRWSELTALNGSVSQSDYRTLPAGSSRSQTQDWSVGASRALSETSSISVSVGSYRTRREAEVPVVVCPLPLSFCRSGLVPFVVAVQTGRSSDRGAQYSASGNWRVSERLEVGLSANRQQSPSGTGVVLRTDGLSASASMTWSPTLNGSMAVSQSRSSYLGVSDGPRPNLQGLTLSLSKVFSEDLSLGATYQWTRTSESRAGVGAQSHVASITLKYDWPKLSASR